MLSFSQLKEIDNGLQIVNDPGNEHKIEKIADFEALSANALVFIKDKNFLDEFFKSDIKNKLFVIISEKLLAEVDSSQTLALATTPSVDISISKISKPFYDLKLGNLNNVVDGRQMGTVEIDPSSWIAQGVFIGEGVKIGAHVQIHPGCVVMSKSVIGDGSILYPNVVVYPFVEIGKACRIHAGTAIGIDGYGYNFDGTQHLKVWHTGGVIVEDNVEMGGNCTIDMGTFSPTIVGAGSKLDNQVHVAHNCKLGKGVILCGQVGLAGSVTLGDFCVLGGKAAVAPGVKMGRGCQVGGASGVTSDWPDGSVLGGHPARPLKEWLKGVAYLRKQSLNR